MRKLLFFVPFALFIGLSLFLLSGLFSDPRQIGSALVERQLPQFQLPDLMQPNKRWTADELKGEPYFLKCLGHLVPDL